MSLISPLRLMIPELRAGGKVTSRHADVRPPRSGHTQIGAPYRPLHSSADTREGCRQKRNQEVRYASAGRCSLLAELRQVEALRKCGRNSPCTEVSTVETARPFEKKSFLPRPDFCYAL